MSTLVICCMWVAMFVFLAHVVYPMVMAVFPFATSKYEEEDTDRWFAWHVQSWINAAIVCYLALQPVIILHFAKPTTEFEPPNEGNEAGLEQHIWSIVRIGQGAHIFLSYIVVDLCLGLYTGLLGLDLAVHHCIFILFCITVSYNC